VSLADGGELVSDDDGGATLGGLIKGLLHDALGMRI
jgi:hypothetical protein